MKIESKILECMHLDPGYAVLSVHNVITCLEYFKILDVHFNDSINDCLFWAFMRSVTNVTREDSEVLFRLMDINRNGEMDFEEFYLLFCILIATLDKTEKEFIYRHSLCVFKLLDCNASGLVNKSEFSYMGILFNFDRGSISTTFDDFDISGDKNLDFEEFRLFAMACIDDHRNLEAFNKLDGAYDYRRDIIRALRPVLMRFLRKKVLPSPHTVIKKLNSVPRPDQAKLLSLRRCFNIKAILQTMHSGLVELQLFIHFCVDLITLPFRCFVKCIWSCLGCKKEKITCRANYEANNKRIAKQNAFNYKYYNRNVRYGNAKQGVNSGHVDVVE